MAPGGLHAPLAVGAVLLAAGAGSRLGGRPKSLLELDGVPLIRRQINALSGAGVDPLVVVLGHHAEAIAAVVKACPVTLVRNPDPDRGQASSVIAGLRTLRGRLDAVIIALADQPLIDSDDVAALIAAFERRPAGASLVAPRVAGEPGNPVMLEAALRDEWLAGEAEAACRRWRRAHPERVGWFDSDNDRYRIDIDTAEDIERLAERSGQRLHWPPAGGGT